MSWLLISPVIIPLITAALALLAGQRIRVQRIVSLVGAAATMIAAIALLARVWQDGILATQLGEWPAPFGISFVADLLGASMAVISGIMGFAVLIYALGTLDAPRERAAFHALYHTLLMGVNGAFLTGDLFNLYVWFEVMLIASFVLLVLGRDREQLRGGVQYVLINLLSSMCFLAAVGMIYGATGTLNMADVAGKLGTVDPGLVTTIAMLFLIAFGIKAALFPLFFWLPPAYPTAPIAIAALFAGLLTKVGVYALIRVFTLIFTQDIGYTHTILLWIAGLTMVTGVLGAAAQSDIRRILSFHIISQIGYMIMGLALFTPLALVGAVFYIIHHIIVKTNLFLIGGVADRLSGGFELERIGGLYRAHPWLAILFLIPAFSLAGFPPLSGFWAKLLIIKAGLDVGQYFIVAVALVVGVLTLFSMTKIWAGAFWTPMPEDQTPGRTEPIVRRPLALLVAPIVALAVLTLVIGLWAEPLYLLAEVAAADLLDPTAYINAVLGTGGLAEVAP
jgi:multicomponent Na+:H+ antiporter subunit D